MITEQEITDQCTLEIIKKMVELAEGFRLSRDETEIHIDDIGIKLKNLKVWTCFPLLVHRAVGGFNLKEYGKKVIVIEDDHVVFWSEDSDECKVYDFKNYQPTTMTHAECAMLDCLIEVLK